MTSRADTNIRLDQDTSQEECQEGNPVLLDGMRRIRHR